jgi:hypothetical protein
MPLLDPVTRVTGRRCLFTAGILPDDRSGDQRSGIGASRKGTITSRPSSG